MKKRWLSLALALCMVLSLLPVGALAANFKDVPADAYYAEPVAWAVENDITKGTSDTTFSPNDTCTRGQVVTFLWRAAGSPAPESAKNPFSDVSAGAYYEDAVLWAVEHDITKGTGATTFSPNQGCTRGQVVTFLHRANGEEAAATVSSFQDVAADAYYANAVNWAVEKEITKGTSGTAFSPDQTCTRGQIVTFLYRDEMNTPASPTESPNLTSVYLLTKITCKSSDGYEDTTTYTYDVQGNLLTELYQSSDGNKYSWNYTYDTRGNQLSAIYADSYGEEAHFFIYDSTGNKLSQTNKYGHDGEVGESTINWTYDVSGNVLSKKSSDGTGVEYTYDLNGNILSKTLIDYTSDGETLGRKITTYTYDLNGKLLSKLDEDGWGNEYTYDANGNMISEKETWSYGERVTIYTYDTNGNKLSEKDKDGNGYEYTYDANGKVLTETYISVVGNADDGTISYEKDKVISYTYDTYGNVLTKKVKDRWSEIEEIDTYSYLFDKNGNLLRQTHLYSDGAESIDRTYDINGNLLSVTYTINDSYVLTDSYEYEQFFIA